MNDVKSLTIIPRMKNCHLCVSFLFERQLLTKKESESFVRSWRGKSWWTTWNLSWLFRGYKLPLEISHDFPTDEKLPLVSLCLFWTPLFNQQRKWKFDQILKKEILMNNVNSITIVSQIKIATCVHVEIFF